MPQNLTDNEVNIDLGNELVPPGNKRLPEPVLTKFCDDIWRQ